MSKPNYILGTGLSHDGSTCLLRDGKIVVAIEKERLTRKKHDGYNDDRTIQYCLDTAGITFKDIDLVVQETTYYNLLEPDEPEKVKGRIIPKDIPTVTISHHLAHAYSAIGTAPFDTMSVVVLDGEGSNLDQCIDVKNCKHLPEEIKNLAPKSQRKYWEFLSYYAFQDGKIQPIFKDFAKIYDKKSDNFVIWLSTLGEFYKGISTYIFDQWFAEGKTMGLAPFGKPNIFSFEAFNFNDGRIGLNKDWMVHFQEKNSGEFLGFFENFQFYANMAYWGQKELEKAVIGCFNKMYELFPNENVAYSGGVALNAVANSKLFSTTQFKNFHVHPSPADNGLAIGCCYYGWLEYFQKEKVQDRGSIYLGRTYENNEAIEILSKNSHLVDFYESDNYIEETANFLAEGKIVGWFQGGSEFGPRALGHRSILADPRKPGIRNFINRKIKHREDFRPFAPSVLMEDLKTYFDCDFEKSPYMIQVGRVRPEFAAEIPAVVHTDLSARVQSVEEHLFPEYYQLIRAFKTKTKLPILLNTSFNGANMPIVETPEEAINFFIEIQNIDVLVINNIIIKNKTPKYLRFICMTKYQGSADDYPSV